jgi:hypothetical protein
MPGCPAWLRRYAVAAGCLFTIITPAHAQVLRGRVVDQASGAPIVEASIRVSGANDFIDGVISDSAGRFSIVLPGAGTYTLNAGRLGYASAGPLGITARRDEIVDIVLRLGTAAVPLAPLEVTARTTASSTLQDVHKRVEQVRRTGIGRAMTRDEIVRRAPVAAATLVSALSPRMTGDAGIRDENTIVVHSGSPTVRDGVATGICHPAVYVDGFRINQRGPGNVNRYLAVEDIEAVEVYLGLGEMPVQYRDPANCGVVLFWSRRAPAADAKVLTWGRAAIAALAITAVVLFGAF